MGARSFRFNKDVLCSILIFFVLLVIHLLVWIFPEEALGVSSGGGAVERNFARYLSIAFLLFLVPATMALLLFIFTAYLATRIPNLVGTVGERRVIYVLASIFMLSLSLYVLLSLKHFF